WGVILVAGLFCWRQLLSWLADVRDLVFQSGRPETPWERFVRAFVIVTLLSALLLALAPPIAWDALNYHLVIPQFYVENGAIIANLDNHFFGFPQNFEMLYGLLMMVGSDTAPSVLHFAVGVLGLMLIYNLVRRHASSKAASVSVLVIMASFSFWLLMGWAYVDIALMSYGAAIIIALQQWQANDKDRHHWLRLMIVLLAMCAGIKYTSIPLIIGVYLFVIWREPKQAISYTVTFAVIGLVLFLPWLTKGLLLYENPVFPYIFGGANWDSVRGDAFSDAGNGLIHQGRFIEVALLPFTATIFGVHRIAPYGFTMGAFWMTMPFLLVLGYSKLSDNSKSLVRMVLPLALVVLIFWMVLAATSGIGAQPRLMLIGGALPAILAGLAYHSLENWKRRPIDIVFITQAVLIFSIFLGSFDYLRYFAESRVLEYHTATVSQERTDRYLTRNLGALYPAMTQLEALPEDSRVLFLWEPKAFYCPNTLTCNGDTMFDHWARPLQMGISSSDLITQWQSEYDYVLIFDFDDGTRQDGYSLWGEIMEHARAENALFPDNFYDTVTEVWSDDIAYTIYTWR
ncbi:MAG: glycosyltransferase family 39 protein, partial [Chloroflexota bacterium]